MIAHRFAHLPLAVAAAVSMGACAPAVSQKGTSASLPAAFDARTVELRSNWRGGPSVTNAWLVRLERQGDTHTFTGTSEMSAGGSEGCRRAAPLPITVPDSAMRAFLQALASAPRRRGAYRTIYTHTHNYPDFTITLRSDAGEVEFFSDSQSNRNWRVTIDGQRYVSGSPIPFDAQEHLKPFYRAAELDRILAETQPVREYAPCTVASSRVLPT